jgi:sarcosine oxidase
MAASGMTSFDVIVAGVGGLGSAACWQLARRGQRVLGLERFDIPHAQGSSHGLTRIIRLAYHEGSAYVPLVQRALALWRDAGGAYGQPLLFTTGSLDAGPDGGGFFEGALTACREYGLPHEILTAAEINRRFHGLRLSADHRGLFQPDGGFVACERAIVAHVTLAQSAGAEIHARETVLGWQPLPGGGVAVTTDRGRYEAGRLILTAGAWTGPLVPALAGVLMPERQVMGWFQPADPAKFAPDALPVTILAVEEGDYYVVPVFEAPGVKIGRHHHLGERTTADAVNREVTAEDEAVLRRALARYLPDANGPVMALRTCLYTVTPDEHFVIDTLPGAEEVIVVSACSGHGYKFASVIGEIVADLATTGRSAFDLSMFRLGRFTR